jgi:hypothetical protein
VLISKGVLNQAESNEPIPYAALARMRNTRVLCLAVALACAGWLSVWQVLTVHYSFGGNWTALFCTGALSKPPPPALRSEKIYLFQNSRGYDGQLYHYIAHDPFFTRGFSRIMDAPRLRYRRILVPGLAFLLALGHDRGIDAAYILVVTGFIFLGAYWLSRMAVSLGYSAASGLLFGAVPAVLVSVDRLTVDVALAACCVGFVLYAQEQSRYKLYAVLATAALVRETGLLLVAAYAIYLLGKRQFQHAIVCSTAAVPAGCWYIFVQLHTKPDNPGFVSLELFTGFIHRVLNPYSYPFSATIAAIASSLDLLALAGIAGALFWAFYRAFRRAWTPVTVAIYLFALLTIALSKGDAWTEIYAFGRTLTPLVLLSALDGLTVGSVIPILSMLALDPRIVLQVGKQILKVARGIAL